LKTKNLTLIAHLPRHLLALLESPQTYTNSSGMRVGHGVRDFLLGASSEFRVKLESATDPDPWRWGFAVVHQIDEIVIGMCGFAAPPDANGVVEIAYSIAPAYQGKGYATEVATALVDYAMESGCVTTVCAHTLPQPNASTRVLEKCGFEKIGAITDQENNLVWRWEKSIPTS
jgi:ribosomal-protein-alanine N-acetyltransferase